MAFDDTKENKKYECPVEIFAIPSQVQHYQTTSNAWLNISGCRKNITVGSSAISCEIMGHATGRNQTSGGGALDLGVAVDGVVHNNEVAKGLGITHTQSWTNLTCHWVQKLEANRSFCIQLQARSRDNKSKCGLWTPYLIIKLYKQTNVNIVRNDAWVNINDLKTNKKQFDINYEYRLSVGTGDAMIIPFKVTSQCLYFYDIIEANDTDVEGDEELIVAKVKYDNKSRIVSKDKNYQKYVQMNKIQFKV
eukprot:481882_1